MPARVLYVGQEVKIAQTSSTGTGSWRYLPVQSASCEVTRPIEDILSFGHLGSLGRVQNAVSTCKADIKSYLANSTGVAASGTAVNLLNADFITRLTGDSLNGSMAVITVVPNGFTMSGILSSLNIDMSQGAFATADLSFNGVGEPIFAVAPTGSSFSEQANMPVTFSPVTVTNVSGQAISGCANSFKFSLDLPNESISCLGGSVTGSQAAVSASFLQVAKPPFKASVTVEGTAVDAPSGASLTNAYIIGKLSIQLPAAQVTSRSFNNAVGNAGATYNYTLEDVSALFIDVQ
jgi:hypothetical protein